MAKFSKRSKDILKNADIRLQQIFNDVIKHYDCSVICSTRNKEDQNKAHRMGFSKVKYPDSLHNHKPSLAVDVIPYPTGYKSDEEFYKLATWVFKAAQDFGVKVVFGGHWKNFKDLPHWQLKI